MPTASRKKSAPTKRKTPADRAHKAKAAGKTGAKTVASRSKQEPAMMVSRATSGYDEDDVLLSGGTQRGVGYGRCGGRMLSSRVEQLLCDLLSRNGVTHSHSPRHFEVRLAEKEVAAYAPMIVLRGRGREGKTVVIEAAAEREEAVLNKIRAFRRSYGMEFYVIFVAPEDMLDELPIDIYDEAAATTDAATLINRLTD